MAGVRAPKARAYASSGASAPENEGEECGDEARFFTESRLLQRNVTVRLLSLPTPQGGNFASGSQATVGSLIGLVLHPAGSIAALLLANGLARVVDWHAGILSSVPVDEGGGMERLRTAEREGKSSRRGIWKGLAAPGSTAGGAATANGKHEAGKKYEAMVARVWSGDSVSVVVNGTEKRVFLSSVRLPRQSETKLAGLVAEARESLRKRIVGKTVSVTLDYVKPADQGFEERECVTVRTHNGAYVLSPCPCERAQA